MKTGYLWDKKFLGHFTSTVHPEDPKRAEALNPHTLLKDFAGVIENIPLVPQVSDHWVKTVHTESYIREVREAHEKNRRWLSTADTPINQDTYETAIQAVSGSLSLLSAVCKGQIKNGFAAIRPPGHHAGPQQAKGFCYFNNAAICARYAQKKFDYKNVLIIDWDVHPGDGTMKIFYEDPSVHLLSIHQHGIFTETIGTKEQTGKGDGVGTTENIPMPKGSRELDYLREFEPALDRAGANCQPDLIILSSGFDAHQADPLGSMKLNENSFYKMTKMVMQLADQHCQGRIVSLLEGGYNPKALAKCVHSHLEALAS